MSGQKLVGLALCSAGGALIGIAAGPQWSHLLQAIGGLALYIFGSALYDGRLDDDNA